MTAIVENSLEYLFSYFYKKTARVKTCMILVAPTGLLAVKAAYPSVSESESGDLLSTVLSF